jgi:hypothetical protein
MMIRSSAWAAGTLLLALQAATAHAQCSATWATEFSDPFLGGNGLSYVVHTLLPVASGVLPAGLVAGGEFAFAGSASAIRLAEWSGTAWGSLGTGANSTIFCATVFDNQLIVGGSFTEIGGVSTTLIAAYNGTNWNSLGNGLSGIYNQVSAVTSFNGQLIAGGSFAVAGSDGNIAAWNGSQWRNLGQGVNGTVQALAVYNGKLLVGGIFANAGGVFRPALAVWNGSTWEDFPGGFPSLAFGGINQFLVEGANLYVVGTFGGPSPGVRMWDGSSWQYFGAGVTPASVNAIALYDNQIFIGGSFSSADGHPASNLARWDGATWQPMGAGADSVVNALAVFDDQFGAGPALYAGGYFEHVDEVSSWYIARWHAQGQPCTGDLNCDNLVNDADFAIFVAAYDLLLCSDPAMPPGCPADLNRDGFVDDSDFQIFVVAYNELLCP